MPPEFADVSVIIPAYRAVHSIGRALASVARQTSKPREAIVVDDGSDDGTYETAMAMITRINGVDLKVFRQPNQGAGAARNRAVQEASCRYVAFLDADDQWLPEKLERSMEHMAGSDYVLVSHDVLVNDEGNEVLFDCARHYTAGDRFVSMYRRGYISTSTVVARRDAVLAAGGFDTTLANAQDFDLWLAMLRQKDASFLVFKGAFTRNHITRSSITSHTERRLRCGLEIARRYAPELKARPGSVLASVWFRVAAIHIEAITTHAKRGKYAAAVWTCVRLPASLLAMSARTLSGGASQNRRFVPPAKELS